MFWLAADVCCVDELKEMIRVVFRNSFVGQYAGILKEFLRHVHSCE